MATNEEKRQYLEQIKIGIRELWRLRPPGVEDLCQALYKDAYPTSTNGDLRLIGAWCAYHQGHTARIDAAWPSRGNTYKLLRLCHEITVKVTDPRDHRSGVTVVAERYLK